MSQDNPILIRLFVENRAEELMAAGIFADFVQNGSLNVRMSWTSSSAISLAEFWLLTAPDVSVALALNCSEDAEEFRTPIRNILSRAGREERWHIALAIPDMTAWLLLDPKFKESVAKAQVPQKRIDIAVHFKEWASKPDNQFDREAVSRQNAEFAALNHFIEEHALSATGSAKS